MTNEKIFNGMELASAEQTKRDSNFSEELTEEELDLVAAAGPHNCFQKLFEKISHWFD